MIVGLGNPGNKYEQTRHNLGFLVVDALAKKYQGEFTDKKSLESEIADIKIGAKNIILAKPQTFMNASGRSVRKLMKKFSVQAKDLLVVLDDADLEYGKVRYRESGSSAGHRGLESIMEILPRGTSVARLRLGIGRPTNKDIELDDYVLQKWSPEQAAWLPEYLKSAVKTIEDNI